MYIHIYLYVIILIFQDGKKKFEKQTIKFCQSQERYLNLSTKKQDNVLQEVYLIIYEKLELYIIDILCATYMYIG